MSAATLSAYGMKPVATVRITEKHFLIEILDNSIVDRGYCIYAFLVGDEIVRIGSSKGILKGRLRAWERDVSAALQGRKSATPANEAAAWNVLLKANETGTLYAREGTMVDTPVGRICAYLDEESTLIGRHLPRLNRSKHR